MQTWQTLVGIPILFVQQDAWNPFSWDLSAETIWNLLIWDLSVDTLSVERPKKSFSSITFSCKSSYPNRRRFCLPIRQPVDLQECLLRTHAGRLNQQSSKFPLARFTNFELSFRYLPSNESGSYHWYMHHLWCTMRCIMSQTIGLRAKSHTKCHTKFNIKYGVVRLERVWTSWIIWPFICLLPQGSHSVIRISPTKSYPAFSRRAVMCITIIYYHVQCIVYNVYLTIRCLIEFVPGSRQSQRASGGNSINNLCWEVNYPKCFITAEHFIEERHWSFSQSDAWSECVLLSFSYCLSFLLSISLTVCLCLSLFLSDSLTDQYDRLIGIETFGPEVLGRMLQVFWSPKVSNFEGLMELSDDFPPGANEQPFELTDIQPFTDSYRL